MAAWLDGELAVVRGELARTDSKCGVLTAIATGAAAFSASEAGHGPFAARFILAAAGVVFAAAVLVLLAVLRPKLGTAGWCRYMAAEPADLRRLDKGEAVELAAGAGVWARDLGPEDLAVLTAITAVKFTRLRVAVDLIRAGIVLLAAGTVAGVIA
jgi:hypothetical protein